MYYDVYILNEVKIFNGSIIIVMQNDKYFNIYQNICNVSFYGVFLPSNSLYNVLSNVDFRVFFPKYVSVQI